jgi:hypothetical protein
LRVVRTPIGDDRMIRLAALTGCTGLLIHGLWDFNLQVPANAAWLFVLIALATMIGRERDRVTHFRTVPVNSRRKRA